MNTATVGKSRVFFDERNKKLLSISFISARPNGATRSRTHVDLRRRRRSSRRSLPRHRRVHFTRPMRSKAIGTLELSSSLLVPILINSNSCIAPSIVFSTTSPPVPLHRPSMSSSSQITARSNCSTSVQSPPSITESRRCGSAPPPPLSIIDAFLCVIGDLFASA